MIWKLTVATGILGAAAFLGAQAPAPQPPADRPTTQPTTEQRPLQPSATKENTVTISGCLKPGASAGSFILADAGMAPAGREAQPAAQGTTGTTKSYNIIPKDGAELSKHVNHKIAVTGTVSASRPPNPPAPEAAPTAAAHPAETLTVQTFKMVAVACP